MMLFRQHCASPLLQVSPKVVHLDLKRHRSFSPFVPKPSTTYMVNNVETNASVYMHLQKFVKHAPTTAMPIRTQSDVDKIRENYQ